MTSRYSVGGDRTVEGPAAHDAAVEGNPLLLGVKALTGDPSSVADGDITNVTGDEFGAMRTIIAGAHSAAADVKSTPDNQDAWPTSGSFYRLLVAASLHGFAPDLAHDRIRTVGNTAGLGLGVLATSPRTPGASEIKAHYDETGSTSTTAEKILDPTSGKLIRILSISYFTDSATAHSLEVYFGVGDTGGANISTNATRAILVSRHDAGAQESERGFWSWPDGAGPVAIATNDGLFIRTDADIGAAGHVVVHYREE
jgi:hypothetical protein